MNLNTLEKFDSLLAELRRNFDNRILPHIGKLPEALDELRDALEAERHALKAAEQAEAQRRWRAAGPKFATLPIIEVEEVKPPATPGGFGV